MKGSGTVHIYNAGDFTLQRAEITTPGDDATQFWVWQKSDTVSYLGSQSKFTGVLHAGEDGEIGFGPNDDGDIYGALIGDLTSGMGADWSLHYDEALESADPFAEERSAGGDTVSHLQISTRTLEVE